MNHLLINVYNMRVNRKITKVMARARHNNKVTTITLAGDKLIEKEQVLLSGQENN